ncbi:unnamed protein product [Allacma fusca]|uniref:Uncharacterized protein n=1 Tax=Allacma fusca TaxID=39272 RepID=A0A8J2JTV0_9HEXA|nr:unnamed protein product [Allacma fusca]
MRSICTRFKEAELLYKRPLIIDHVIFISIMKIFTICLILSACALALCHGEPAVEATEIEVDHPAGIVKRNADVGEAENKKEGQDY